MEISKLIEDHIYVCDICGHPIIPKIDIRQDGTCDITSTASEISGGKGNQIIYRRVCEECAKKMQLQR